VAIILPNGPVPVTPDKSKFYSLASLLAFGLTNYLSPDSDSNPKSNSVFNYEVTGAPYIVSSLESS
jgi:hypothetical protein